MEIGRNEEQVKDDDHARLTLARVVRVAKQRPIPTLQAEITVPESERIATPVAVKNVIGIVVTALTVVSVEKEESGENVESVVAIAAGATSTTDPDETFSMNVLGAVAVMTAESVETKSVGVIGEQAVGQPVVEMDLSQHDEARLRHAGKSLLQTSQMCPPF